MSRILREPLLHFLLIGALLFSAYALVSDRNRDTQTIVVGEGQVANLSEGFQRTWQRPPTPEELNALVESFVRDEVMYREGVALGLDRDDAMIRRRVRQKVEFLNESVNGVPEPDDAAMQAYLDKHRERFRDDPKFTFVQIYLGTNDAKRQAQLLLPLLQGPGGDRLVARAGVPTQLPQQAERAPSADVTRVFGEGFTAALAKLPVGVWQGPVTSSYGLHLVRVAERVEAQPSTLSEVREQVKREWARDAVAAAGEKYYAGLRARYQVRIENTRVAALKQ